MNILEFDDWPQSNISSGRPLHPMLEETIRTIKSSDKVVRFTEADLQVLPNKNLVLVEQRLRALAKQHGFRVSCLHREEGAERVMYVRRNTAKRR